ncbi:PREDICTED: uncharacterized protein LOC106726815 [Myotis brandtii]|uniref:uncharacterized protein LOC106726815 n=1 Tax=Myotis brandtii TaxID=109478 RepID=UPI0007044817|nr:PREDICTED: uncharacterized protein LOC106726815 [Myotis brandtii]
MEEQAPQRGLLRTRQQGPWKRNSSQELPDRRQRLPQAPRHFLKTVGSRKEKRLILGATPQTAKGQHQALLQGKDDIKFSPVSPLEDGLGLPDGQGTGNPVQFHRDANGPDSRENEIEEQDAAIQPMLWGLHCPSLLSVVSTVGRAPSLTEGCSPCVQVVLNETVAKD